jgi:hypothetical protein
MLKNGIRTKDKNVKLVLKICPTFFSQFSVPLPVTAAGIEPLPFE